MISQEHHTYDKPAPQRINSLELAGVWFPVVIGFKNQGANGVGVHGEGRT